MMKNDSGFWDMLTSLENALGYTFTQRDLLHQALTHASMPGTVSYERLEFLGDRVLGLVMAEWLLEAFPTESEGAIAKRFAALVRKEALLQVAEALNLSIHVRSFMGDRALLARGQDGVLADCCEALIAALYLDAGLDTARAFIRRYWDDQLTQRDRPPQDAKSALQEWAQARGYDRPEYTIIETKGPDHNPDFTIKVTVKGLREEIIATGTSKKQAEQRAAEQALRWLA
jgi:ribonuclease-3